MTAEGRSEEIKDLLDCSMTHYILTYDTLCKVYPLEWLTKWSSTGKSHIRFPGKGI